MARKTVARRLFKQLPLNVDAITASMLTADDEHYDHSPGPLSDLPTDISLDEEIPESETEIHEDPGLEA
jgi:recombinational DNA repair protein RecT